MKQAVVGLIGREAANRLSAPYYDWLARRRTQRRLSTLPQTDLCVNLGCGPKPLAGWINLDRARAPHVDIVWDLRQGLPFPAGSCGAIFGEHMIEHLAKEDAQSLVRDCYRALQRGGVIRLSTPDAGRYLRSYAGDRDFLRHPKFSEDAETALDRINHMMREGGQHLWVYDAESLACALRRAGFVKVVEQPCGVSLHPRMNNIDQEVRAFESLYMEGMK